MKESKIRELPNNFAVKSIDYNKYNDYGSFIARKGLRDRVTGHDKIKRIGVATAIPLALARGANLLLHEGSKAGLKPLSLLSFLGAGGHTAAKYMQLKSDKIDRSTKYRNLAMGLGTIPAGYSTYMGIKNLKNLGRAAPLGKKLIAASSFPLAASYFALPMIFGGLKKDIGSLNMGIKTHNGRVELFNKEEPLS